MTGSNYRHVYQAANPEQTQAGGAFTVTVDANALRHQISTTNDGGTTGVLAVEVKPYGSDRFEVLTVGGSPVQIDLAADGTFGPFDGLFTAMRLTPTGFDGTAFDVFCVGW